MIENKMIVIFFFRDDAHSQQACGDTSLTASEEVRTSFSTIMISDCLKKKLKIKIFLIVLSSAGDSLMDTKQFMVISTKLVNLIKCCYCTGCSGFQMIALFTCFL